MRPGQPVPEDPPPPAGIEGPDLKDKSLWLRPWRKFGDSEFFRTGLTSSDTTFTTKNSFKADEWKVSSIAINPNTTELISLANNNLTYAQKKDFLKKLYPDSVFFGASDPIPYQDILLNPTIVTSSKANTFSKEWIDTLRFWAYPNGEFLPVTSSTNFASYLDVYNYPPERGNPQRGVETDYPYQLIKNENQVFEITSVPTAIRFGNKEFGITKTYDTLGARTCDINEFGLDPAPGIDKYCYKLQNSVNNLVDDVLALYPKPPLHRQTVSKPIVRYASRVKKKDQLFVDERWIYLRYFRHAYNASDMQCAITKKPTQLLFNKQYLLFYNGYAFKDDDYIDLQIDPNLFNTSKVSTEKEVLRKIEVTCNPSLIGTNKNSNSELYVQTMVKYCGAGNESMYQDSIKLSGADSNMSRKDEEGNALGLGTLERWNSNICKDFTRDNLLKSTNNFKSWCSNIENWTENGGCFNMANAVNPETQQSVNNTLQNLCQNEVLDEKPCLQYCFAKNTDNLDCSSHLGMYCRKLVIDSIKESFPSSTFSSNSNTVTQLPVITHTTDGFQLSLKPSQIDSLSRNILKNHPQCSCFMPIESFRAYYDKITEDFPPSPELNAFILHFYQQPNCSYSPCVFQQYYKPRGVTIPVLKDVASVTNVRCPKGSHRITDTVEPNAVVPEKLWLHRCVPDNKAEVEKKYTPFCPDTFTLQSKCKIDNNGISCTSEEFQCTKTTQYIGGQCPNIISCVQNAVFQVELTGVKAKVNIEGEVSISNECDLQLSKFNRFVDTKLVAVITNNQSIYDLCYNNELNVITLQTQRAQKTGTPVSTPRVSFKGYFERNQSNDMELIITSVLSGELPNPTQNPQNPTVPTLSYSNSNIVGEYVTHQTRITAIGLSNGGSSKNLHTFLVTGQSTNLGNESQPLSLYIENDQPSFDTVEPEILNEGQSTFTKLKPMDFVHVYESNAWLTMTNNVPTKFKGKLNKVSNTIEIESSSIRGPLGPGKLSNLHGIKKETYLKERISQSPLVWSFESLEPYEENISVDMYVTNSSVNRYFTGYVKEVFPTSINIVCMETNEEENQLQWSFSNTDYRSLNASGQMATHWVITKDGEDQYVPSGDKVDEKTWETIVETIPKRPSKTDPTKPANVGEQEYFPPDQIKSNASVVIFIVIGVVLLIVIAIVLIILLRKKK